MKIYLLLRLHVGYSRCSLALGAAVCALIIPEASVKGHPVFGNVVIMRKGEKRTGQKVQ